jgi:hypothetical protein
MGAQIGPILDGLNDRKRVSRGGVAGLIGIPKNPTVIGIRRTL